MVLAVFPIFTNIFYLINVILAGLVGWFYLLFLYLAVFITSTLYHVCNNVDWCGFDWDTDSWRKLDHIMAWLALSLTAVYGVNPEKYYTRIMRKPKHSFPYHLLQLGYQLQLGSSFYMASVDFFVVLLLVEIVYFSVNMIDDNLIPPLVIGITLLLSVLVPRIILHLERPKIKKHLKKRIHSADGKKSNYIVDTDLMWQLDNTEGMNKFLFFGHVFSAFFLVLALICAALACVFFMVKEDSAGTFHGLWHMFGAMAGSLFILSIYLS
jgi:hypothetical protein